MLTGSDCGPLFVHTILNVPDSGVIQRSAILDVGLLLSVFFSNNVSETGSVSVTRIGLYSVPFETEKS
jgi:hypothetical protein